MKKYSLKIAAMLVLFFMTLDGFAQITPQGLQQFLQEKKTADIEKIKRFYNRLNYQAIWLKKQGDCKIIFDNIKNAAGLGLNQKDYDIDFMQSFFNGKINLKSITDSLEAEVTITTIAIHFYTDMAYGNAKPVFGYDGMHYPEMDRDIPVMLADYISNKNLMSLQYNLSSGVPEIAVLQNKIRWYSAIMNDSNFKEIIDVPVKPGINNKSLLVKLYQMGIAGELTDKLPDSTLKRLIKIAQLQFGLLSDGVIRSTLVEELNIPLIIRLRQLDLAINYYRWLNRVSSEQPVVVVNIPAAYMKVYNNKNIIMDMRMVVGKPSTPTPTLTSTITEVILYPYWHVPTSIATKEMLPILKRNPEYINTGGFQVLDKNGKIINPLSIKWSALSRTYFPYTIRQSTGCDNALGLIKLNFYSPYGVYLHDTPTKNAFAMNKRYFSHGCMRMEKPMELGHLVMANNSIAIDTLELKGCLRNQSPVTVRATRQLPVIVWYNPAGIDAEEHLVFYDDVYGKFHWWNIFLD